MFSKTCIFSCVGEVSETILQLKNVDSNWAGERDCLAVLGKLTESCLNLPDLTQDGFLPDN